MSSRFGSMISSPCIILTIYIVHISHFPTFAYSLLNQDKLQGEFVKRKKCVMRRCITLFDIQPKLPTTKSTPSGKKEAAVEGEQSPPNEGGDSSQPQNDESVAKSPAAEVDGEKEIDDSNHEEVCFVCRDGGGEFIHCLILLFSLTACLLNILCMCASMPNRL